MKYILTINSLLIAIIVYFFIISISFANIYKWIDENGNTQLSDLPPLKKDARNLIVINTKAQGTNIENPNYSKTQNSKFIKTKNCAIAQNNLEKLNHSNIILDKNKKLIKLSKDDHLKKIFEAKIQIEYFC